MRVLVTGGAGFVGSHLCERLVERGHKVRVIDNLSSGYASNVRGLFKNPNFYFARGDFMDMNLLERMMHNVDVVFHLAARIHPDESVANPEETWRVNVLGTQMLFEMARMMGVSHVIYASSSEVYGNVKVPMSDYESDYEPSTPYAVSKLAGDRLARSYWLTYGFPVTIVRCFNMYGMRQRERGYGLVIPRFVGRALKGLPLLVYGSGEQTRDFMWVEDGVEGYIKVMENRDKVLGEPINFGTGVETKIADLAWMIVDLTDSGSEIERVGERAGEVSRMCAAITKARKLLGWTPTVSIREGLKKYIGTCYGREDEW